MNKISCIWILKLKTHIASYYSDLRISDQSLGCTRRLQNILEFLYQAINRFWNAPEFVFLSSRIF